MSAREGVGFNKRHIRRHFTRAAPTYDSAAVLERTIADQLIERLDVVKLTPVRILDVGCATGYATRLLAKRYRQAQIIGVDIAFGMARRARRRAGWFARTRFVNADAEFLPLPTASVDMVVSNAAICWCDLPRVLNEFGRVLRPDGLFVFTTYGPDTLGELRDAWRQVDNTAHIHDFIDMHDVGDALVRAGFADPVMDVERYALTYADVAGMLRDLRTRGIRNAHPDRARHLTGKGRIERFRAAYASQTQDARLPLTYEVVYGHAWVPRSRPALDGTVRIPLEKIGRRR